MNVLRYIYLWACLASLFSCTLPSTQVALPSVTADVETEVVNASSEEDAADDPAIWIHPNSPDSSLIIGSNKTYGIALFTLSGDKRIEYQVGRVNNIDVRYNFPLNDSTHMDIVAGSERNNNHIVIMGINPSDRSLTPLGPGLPSQLAEVYGFCLYQSPIDSNFYAFVNGKSGKIEQWLLTATDSATITGEIVRTFQVATQPEGMVADDKTATLYVGEEMRGIWHFPAEPNQEATPTFIPHSGADNDSIAFDIEGLAIYRSEQDSFLLASSQGNHSYAVFTLDDTHRYLGSFHIGDDEAIDGTEDTDGIEVTSQNLGLAFPQGIFVAQDGRNVNTDGFSETQNFKIVRWEKVRGVVGLDD